jgi:hypothetical protein
MDRAANMKIWTACLLASCCSGLGISAANAAPQRRFLCIDNFAKKNQLIHVDQHDRRNSWAVTVPGSPARDIQLVGKNRVLISVPSGCQEHDLKTGKKLWEIKGYRGVNSARRLPDGKTLIGANAKEGITIYTVDRAGKELSRQVVYPETGSLRVFRLTKEGNFLFTVGKPRSAIEITPQGKIVWQVSLEPFSGKGYKILKTDKGHYLASTGDGVKVIEFAADGKMVRYWGDKKKGEHADWRLDFFSGFDVMPSGNVAAANWLGHGKHGTGPHVVEFNAGNVLVWQWEDHKLARQVTNVLMLDGREKEIETGCFP